jgi:hypothetical protein
VHLRVDPGEVLRVERPRNVEEDGLAEVVSKAELDQGS